MVVAARERHARKRRGAAVAARKKRTVRLARTVLQDAWRVAAIAEERIRETNDLLDFTARILSRSRAR